MSLVINTNVTSLNTQNKMTHGAGQPESGDGAVEQR